MRAVGIMRSVVLASTVAASVAGLVTLAALEAGPVALLRSTAADGAERRTHVWFVEHDGAWWIESATPERPFYLDLSARPDFLLDTRDGPFESFVTHRVRAELVAEPGGHDRIRALLAARYGWADRWVALLTDTSASRAVKAVARSD